MINLVDGSAFPGYDAQRLQFYDAAGRRVQDGAGEDLLYLPFVDFSCLLANVPELNNSNLDFVSVTLQRYVRVLYMYAHNLWGLHSYNRLVHVCTWLHVEVESHEDHTLPQSILL